MRTLWLALIAVFAATTIGLADAEAKRLGGGRSFGKQAPPPTMQRDAAPPAAPSAAPGAPASPQAAAPRAGAPGTAAAAGGSRWMAPIAGLAAGLGLAALASYLGFGEELASIMLIVLMAIVALVVIRAVMSRRGPVRHEPAVAGAGPGAGTHRYSGLDTGAGDARGPAVPGATARPSGAAHAGGAVGGGAVAQAAIAAGELPPGFDAEGFVRSAKVHFVRLQAAFDAADTDDLREFTSPEMFAELKLEIDERRGAPNQTDVVTLDARLLGVERGAADELASVRFTGMLREQPGAAAEPFDEVWNFARPTSGSGGWVLAGIQQAAKA